MDITIEPFSEVHTEDLRILFQETRRNTFTWADPLEFRLGDFDRSIAGESVMVAVIENKPIGFVSWWVEDNFVHNLFIDRDFHGRGIGKRLLETCLARLARPARLKCLTANQHAMDFYLHNGWVLESIGQSVEGEYGLMRLDR